MENKLDKNYWNKRYSDQTAVWDMGQVSPPLKAYIDQLPNKDIAVLIPGCGNAYEAEYLLAAGFTNITLIDLSSVLVHALEQKLSLYNGKQLHVICGNFFDLQQKFDLVLEQTFFCALDPSLRMNYVEKMADILNPVGKLVGVLFNRDFEENPPFGGSKTEYQELFAGKFYINTMDGCYNSIERRKDSELFINFQKA